MTEDYYNLIDSLIPKDKPPEKWHRTKIDGKHSIVRRHRKSIQRILFYQTAYGYQFILETIWKSSKNRKPYSPIFDTIEEALTWLHNNEEVHNNVTY